MDSFTTFYFLLFCFLIYISIRCMAFENGIFKIWRVDLNWWISFLHNSNTHVICVVYRFFVCLLYIIYLFAIPFRLVFLEYGCKIYMRVHHSDIDFDENVLCNTKSLNYIHCQLFFSLLLLLVDTFNI